MGNKYDAAEMKSELSKLDSHFKTIETQLDTLGKATNGVVHSDQFMGQYQESVQAFYEDVQMEAMNTSHTIANAISTLSKLLQAWGGALDGDASAIIDNDYLKNDLIKELSMVDENIRDDRDEVRKILKKIQDIVSISFPENSPILAIMNGKKKLEQIIREVDKFSKKELDKISNLSTLSSYYNKFLSYMESCQTPEGLKYNKGDLKKQPWYSYMKLAENKVKQDIKDMNKTIKGIDQGVHKFSTDPVNMSTGNLIYDKVDIITSSLSPLTFKRFYNSIDTYKGNLGNNWIHNFEMSIQEITNDDSELSIIFEDGHVEEFKRLDDDSNEYLSNKLNRLVYDNNRYYLHLDNEIRIFNERKKLIRIDNNIKPISLEYDFNNRLEYIRSANEYLKLEYNDSNLIVSITNEKDFEVTYSYDKANNLISSDDTTNKIYQYKYDEYSNLMEVINPRNINILKNYYDNNSRATKQEFPDGSTMYYNYDDVKQVVELIERDGSIINYYHDDKYRNTKVEYMDGYEEFKYNNDDKRTMHTDKNGNVYKYRYDELGNLITMIDPYRNKREFEYNETNKITKVVLENDAISKFKYDNKDNLISYTNALNNEMIIKYNHQNLPIEIQDFDGSIKQSKYDDNGNLIKIVDEFNNETLLEYNEYDQVIKVVKPDKSTIEYTYTLRNKIESITNELGYTKYYEYTHSDEVSKIIDFDGSTITYEYNSLNKVNKIVEANGAITLIEYDKMWNISKIAYPNDATHSYEYNKLNQLEEYTNELGGKISYEYDKNGNRIKIEDSNNNYILSSYDALNREISQIDSMGSSMSLEYDEVGNIIKSTNSLGYSKEFKYDLESNVIEAKDENDNITKYSYTKLNQVASIINPNGGIVEYEYYYGGLVKSYKEENGKEEYYKYNELQQLISIEDKEGNITSYVYDNVGNIIKVIDALDNVQEYVYDKANNIIKKIDELKRETIYEYDKMNNLIKVVDSNGSVMHYSYDNVNELIKVEQAKDINSSNKEMMYEYIRDKASNIIKTRHTDGSIEEYEYNEYGMLIKEIARDNSTKSHKYGLEGLLESIEYSDGKVVSYEYDLLKQVNKISNELGSINIEYDKLGNVIKVQDINNKLTSYKYGKLNELLEIGYPSNKKVEYQYDNKAQLTKMINDDDIVNYEYDRNGRLITKNSNNTTTQFSYDGLNRISTLVHKLDDKILSKYEYTYDGVSNITKIVNLDNIESYQYDRNDRLIEVIRNENDIRKYEYDYRGNRTKFINNNQIINYEYNNMNQLIKEDNKEYQYDNRGRLIRVLEDRNTIKELVYSQDNKLIKVNHNNNEVKFQYDGLAKLVAKEEKINNIIKNTRYSINHIMPWNDILEEQQDSTNKVYTFDGLGIHSINKDRMMLEHLGTPTNIISSNNESRHLNYDEFGNILSNKPEEYGYIGYLYDEISQLNYAQARFYNPQIGRFISEDNIINNGIELRGFNRYNYVESNPLKYVDRDGNKPTVPNVNPNVSGAKTNTSNTNWDGVGVISEIFGFISDIWEGRWEKYVGKKNPFKIGGAGINVIGAIATYYEDRDAGKSHGDASAHAIFNFGFGFIPVVGSFIGDYVYGKYDKYLSEGTKKGGLIFWKDPRNQKYGPFEGGLYKCIE